MNKNGSMIRANFKVSKKNNINIEKKDVPDNNRKLTKEEFENYMIKSGAVGSFMIFRSDKKADELGLEEL